MLQRTNYLAHQVVSDFETLAQRFEQLIEFAGEDERVRWERALRSARRGLELSRRLLADTSQP